MHSHAERGNEALYAEMQTDSRRTTGTHASTTSSHAPRGNSD